MIRHLSSLLLVLHLVLVPSVTRADDGAETPTVPSREPYHDPNWAALKGALLPGSVHMQYGQEERGTFFALGALVLLPVAAGFVEIPLLDDEKFSRAIGIGGYVTCAMVAAGDSYSIVEQMNVENGYHLGEMVWAGSGSSGGVRVTLVHGRF